MVKVMWKSRDPSTNPGHEAFNAQSLGEGDIEIPGFEMTALVKALEASSNLLPESGRTFQDWRVGLLRRPTG